MEQRTRRKSQLKYQRCYWPWQTSSAKWVSTFCIYRDLSDSFSKLSFYVIWSIYIHIFWAFNCLIYFLEKKREIERELGDVLLYDLSIFLSWVFTMTKVWLREEVVIMREVLLPIMNLLLFHFPFVLYDISVAVQWEHDLDCVTRKSKTVQVT